MWKYRSGARHKTPAIDAANELERIRQQYGKLQASIVVEESKSKTAVLHGEFEWDDPKAAKQWRLNQARQLIRDVVYVESDTSTPLQYYHVPSESQTEGHEGHYEFVKQLVNSRSKYQTALGNVILRLEASEEAVLQLLEASKGSNDDDVKRSLSSVTRTLGKAKDAIRNLPQELQN